MSALLSEIDRNKMYDILADAYIEVVRRQMLGSVERKILSQKILDGIRNAGTFEESVAFVDNLLKTYPYFEFARTMFDGEVQKIREEKVISQLQHFIHQ